MNRALPGGLLALSALLCAGLVAEAILPVREIALPAASPAKDAATPAVPAFTPPPQARFAAVAARPLFNPVRQAFADTGPSSSSVTPPQAALIGVIISSGRSIAILKPSAGGPAASVAAGDDFQGWRVLKIEAGRVTFRGGSGDYEMALRPPGARDGAPSATATPPPASTPPVTTPSKNPPGVEITL
jgi:hypothetical protein